jgi:hypothetical protein
VCSLLGNRTQAAEIVALLYQLAEIVEIETGLVGFDLQLERPVADGPPDPKEIRVFWDAVTETTEGWNRIRRGL